MSGQSLGLIETVGLTVAVEAADAAMKSANVDLVRYELTKGGGLVTVKFTGDVGAMNAAVAAGVAAANRIGQVYAWKVLPNCQAMRLPLKMAMIPPNNQLRSLAAKITAPRTRFVALVIVSTRRLMVSVITSNQ